MELRSFSHVYGQIAYHIVLVPKYRYRIFYNNRVKKGCESILNNICTEKGYKIHSMEVVEDHVHLFLEFHLSTSLSEVLQHLKFTFRPHPLNFSLNLVDLVILAFLDGDYFYK